MTASEFNERNKVGCSVTLTDDFGKEHQTVTTSLAWEVSGIPVVSTKLYRCYDLSRITPMAAEAEIK